jgi:hypothetical protein
VAELVDARDLGSRGESFVGSSPSARTTNEIKHLDQIPGRESDRFHVASVASATIDLQGFSSALGGSTRHERDMVAKHFDPFQ